MGFYSSQTQIHFLTLWYYKGPSKENKYQCLIFLLCMLGLDVEARGRRTSGLWTVPQVLTGLEFAAKPCAALAHSEGRCCCQLGFLFSRYNGDVFNWNLLFNLWKILKWIGVLRCVKLASEYNLFKELFCPLLQPCQSFECKSYRWAACNVVSDNIYLMNANLCCGVSFTSEFFFFPPSHM